MGSGDTPVATERAHGDYAVDVLRWRERQYATLAEIGLLALRHVDIDVVLDHTARRLREALDADFTKVLDHRVGVTGLLLRAGDGWEPGVVGNREVPEGAQSQGGYTLLVGEPVIVDDLATETRFVPPALLLEHGVRSGISVVIEGGGRVLGVLQADKREPDHFGEADIPVLQAYANVLGGAMAQHERERLSEEFAVMAAHELRTPLTAVMGFGARLLRRLDENGQITAADRDEVEAIYEQSMRLWRSVELFLALGDAERRTLSRSRSDVDLLDVVEDVAASVAERYGDRKISIEPATASTTFPSDEVALVRILSNLVENGVKYSPRGSTVRVVVAIDEAGANVSVTDACGGMAADDLRRAFQWSYQGNGSKDTNTGLGVGLYVAQRLTERLEGELEARNDGDGCTFSLHLPAP